MNSVINVYKEKGCTSFKVVAAIRSMTGVRKAGHLGTLDPDAEGVLPVCLGKAARLMGLLEDGQKEYHAVMQLGITTDTLDITGGVLRREIPYRLNDTQIKEAFDHFTGRIEQIPPMYSALKVGGVKLVDAARKGIEIERKPRSISIFGYSDIEYDPDNDRIAFTVRCSRGTYIRTLCEDIGSYLRLPACMYSLIRTESAGLRIENAHTLDEIREIFDRGDSESIMISPDKMLEDRPAVFSESAEADKKLYAGNFLGDNDFVCDEKLSRERLLSGCQLRIYDSKGEFIALYYYDVQRRALKCAKMLNEIHN